MDGNMARLGIVLQAIKDRPAADHRQINIERNCVGLVYPRQSQAGVAAQRHHALEALFTRHVQQDPRKAQIILNNQEYTVTWLNRVAIIFYLARTEQLQLSVAHIFQRWRQPLELISACAIAPTCRLNNQFHLRLIGPLWLWAIAQR